jgi:hypothetical protein
MHVRIAYPESYKIIKTMWYNQNKPVEIINGSGSYSDLFTALLMMNDPEAQEAMDREIKMIAGDKMERQNKCYSLFSELRPIFSSFSLKKSMELLSIWEQLQIDGYSPPFDFSVFATIKPVFINNGLDVSWYSEDIKEIRKHKNQIISEAGDLIGKLEQEERCRANLPYDYIPDISK